MARTLLLQTCKRRFNFHSVSCWATARGREEANVCKDCQEKIREKYNEIVQEMTPGQQKGTVGKLLINKVQLLMSARCKHEMASLRGFPKLLTH